MYNKDRNKKILKRIKECGLPFGIIEIVLGETIIDEWGTTMKEGRQYWYTVHYEVINVVGVIGVIILCIGFLSCIAWLYSSIILKISVPCPKCGGLLIQHQHPEICPYCSVKLDWGYSADNTLNKKQDNPLMQYCPECGKRVDDGAVFCTNCGKKVN